MGVRRRLFLTQMVTLGIVTVGAIGGWGLSLLIGQGPREQAERVALERDHLAHMSYDLLGATPHTGKYLISSPADLILVMQRDIHGLRRFRQELDEHLSELILASADPRLHRELETLRLLTVQVEQSLSTVEHDLRMAQLHGQAPDRSKLEAIARHPSIALIRRHSELLSGLHESLDDNYKQLHSAEQRAAMLGVLTWIALVLVAWVVGLTLTWRTGEHLFKPLVQLEQLMRQPPDQLEDQLSDPLFEQAPSEVASLSRSFQSLVLEVKQLLSQLEDQLRTDGLTAVGNRRHFDQMFEQEWKRALRSGEPLSLLLLDLDHFKQYNDRYGHIEGDRCLQQVAQAIRGQARRSSDLVCRIGGEEFAVLLPSTATAEAARVAQGIVRAIDHLAIAHADSQVAAWVTASIGVASCTPTSTIEPVELMKRADGALYTRKKEQGRHGICLADADDNAG
ncbi:MAG: diguanylate cyclase [Vulcanococcus sp.]